MLIESIQKLLNYGKETQLGMGLFYKDTVGYLNEFDPKGDNTGLNKRHEFGNLSKIRSYRKNACQPSWAAVKRTPVKINIPATKEQLYTVICS